MNQKVMRIGVTALVLAGAFGGLMWYSLRSDTEYYKHVDEVMATPQQWEGKKLQLHGFVHTGAGTTGYCSAAYYAIIGNHIDFYSGIATAI